MSSTRVIDLTLSDDDVAPHSPLRHHIDMHTTPHGHTPHNPRKRPRERSTSPLSPRTQRNYMNTIWDDDNEDLLENDFDDLLFDDESNDTHDFFDDLGEDDPPRAVPHNSLFNAATTTHTRTRSVSPPTSPRPSRRSTTSTIDLSSSPQSGLRTLPTPNITTTTTTTSLQNPIRIADDDVDLLLEPPAALSKTSDGTNNNSTEADDDNKCAICFDCITNRTTLDGCTHAFCWGCIKEWSDKSNVCPLCRERFHSLRKKDPSGKKAKRLSIPDRDFRPPEPQLNFHELQQILGGGVSELQRMMLANIFQDQEQRRRMFQNRARQSPFYPDHTQRVQPLPQNTPRFGSIFGFRFGSPVPPQPRPRANNGPAPVIDLTGDD